MLRFSSGLLAAISVSLAFAQENAPPSDAVVVTATRFPDVKRDLPVGVTVITAHDIRKSASSNLGEILAQFGLLQIRDLAGTQNPQLDLRGFGITGDQNTLVLVDGLRLSEPDLESAQLSAIPLDAIERIEIVRGGGAVLYGEGATGGTINIITKRARPGETRAGVLGRAGGYGTEEARAGFERVGANFGGGVAASYEDTDGYRSNSAYRERSALANLDGFSSEGRLHLKAGADEQRARLPGSLTEAQIDQDPRQTNTPDDWRSRDGGHVLLGGTRYFGENELSADLGYRQRHTQAFFAAFAGFFTDTTANLWSFTPRARLPFRAAGRSHELVVGADVERWDYGTQSSSAPGLPAFSIRNGNQASDAVYAQASVWPTSRTRLVLGVREQRTTQTLDEEVFPPSDRRLDSPLEAYEVALRQAFGPRWSGYAKYGKSFRVANFDENACFFPPCSLTLLEPQTALGGELGLEYESGAVRMRASIYRIDLENEIYFSPLAGANVNLSPTRRSGVELESAWKLTDTVDARAGLALLQAVFRSGVYGGVDVSGNTIPLVPDVIATGGLSWAYRPGSRAGVNVRYVGEQFFDNDQANTFGRKQPAYGLVDAKLEHELAPAWRVALEVRNLFDKRYFSYGAATGTTFSALPAPGRAAYLSLAWRI